MPFCQQIHVGLDAREEIDARAVLRFHRKQREQGGNLERVGCDDADPRAYQAQSD